MSRSFSEEDVAWLKELHDRYYPYEKGGFAKPVVQAYETAEFERVIHLIEEYDPPIEMVCTGMFGGYGMKSTMIRVILIKPEFLLLFHEEHIPSTHSPCADWWGHRTLAQETSRSWADPCMGLVLEVHSRTV